MSIVIQSGITIQGGITIGASNAPIILVNGSAQFTVTPTQYLSVPNSTAFTQNQPFTIECWFYPTTLNGGYVYAMLQPNFLCVTYRNSGKFVLDMSYVGNPPGYTPQNRTYPINNWYHIALTWNGTNGWLFINGVIEATFTGAGALTSDGNPFRIGQYQGQGQPTPLGYVSNFRAVKGVAVYTAAFTVPTTNFATTQSANTNGNPSSAITAGQTQLLLNTYNGANFLADSSTNNFTVTNVGSVTSSAITPFGVV
jgi:Concanavalin A-like lectin/glucanases superfamily